MNNTVKVEHLGKVFTINETEVQYALWSDQSKASKWRPMGAKFKLLVRAGEVELGEEIPSEIAALGREY